MRFEIFAPKRKGIGSDKVLRKVVITTDNAQDEKDLYELMGHIHIVHDKMKGTTQIGT